MKDTPAERMAGEMAALAHRLEESPLDDAMRECAGVIQRGFGENVERAAGSEGEPWPPRKVEGDGHPLLNDTGALLAAATGEGAGAIEEVEGRELAVGVDKSVDLGGIPGAAAHNWGYPPGNLPQRKYAYATNQVVDDCLERVADEAAKAMLGE